MIFEVSSNSKGHSVTRCSVRKIQYSHSIYNGQSYFINRFRKIKKKTCLSFLVSSKDSALERTDAKNAEQRLGSNFVIEWLPSTHAIWQQHFKINDSHPSFISRDMYFLSVVAFQEGSAQIFIKRMRYIWIVMTERAWINWHFTVTEVNSK